MSNYKIVRTYSAGVFAGELESRNGKEVVLRNARWIWHWDGAATIHELATKGTSLPDKCKFPAPVDRVLLTEAIQIVDVTEEAEKSIKGVPAWTNF